MIEAASLLRSSVCSQEQLESACFRAWAERLREPFRWYRKLWEYCYIAQALYERGMLQPGRRGLGFAVGQEPLPALFASFGCEIVATDMETDRAAQLGWVRTQQHSESLTNLNSRGICDDTEFKGRTSFRTVNMNQIPRDLRGFDFCWSSCAFEHLGTIALGKRFIERMTRCVKPGGVAVHTTEFNITSNTATRDHDEEYVLFRQCDFEDMAARLQRMGHHIDFDFTLGTGEKDRMVDREPFSNMHPEVHLRLQIDEYVATSIGLIVEIGRPTLRQRLSRGLRTLAGK
jgi:SAM-dependent methyltransferase